MEPRDTTPAERVQQILGNAAYERVSGPLRQSTLRPMVPASSSDSNRNRQPSEELATAFPSLYRATSANADASPSSGRQCQQYPYNPHRNYAPSSSRRPRRSRSTPYSSVSVQHKNIKTFVKTVVLVDPMMDIIPKGKRRQQACDEGCVVDLMEFRSDWSERDVIAAIEAAFDKVFASGPSPK